MWPGWASLVLAQKPYASKIQSCKVTLRSTTDLVICSEPQPAYESPCLHVREHFQQQEEEEEDAWVKEHKSGDVTEMKLRYDIPNFLQTHFVGTIANEMLWCFISLTKRNKSC